MKEKLKTHLTCVNRAFTALIIFLIMSIAGFSQNVGISPTGAIPDANAGLDVNFTTKGLLVPRIALISSTSFLPLGATHVAGMIVYNTASVSDVSPGLYYNNGTKWTPVFPKTTTNGLLYWDGTTWQPVPAGVPGQRLQLVAGIPAWMP